MGYNQFLNPMSREEYSKEPYLAMLQRKLEEEGRLMPFSRGVVRLCVTEKCNYECVFCHNEGMPGVSKFLEVEDIRTMLSAYKDWIKDIKLVGGEPLMHPQFDKVVDLCNKICKTSVTTNGVFIKKWFSSLMKLRSVTVSIQSLDNKRYGQIMGTNTRLNSVLNGIGELLNAGMDVHINCVVTTKNRMELEGINEPLRAKARSIS